MAYIYQIVNDINDKVYVGKTEFSIEKRFQQHCQDSKKRRCEKRPLYSAMRKYGIEHFRVELLEETDNPEEREQYWIEQKNSYGKTGYNATKRGDGKRYLDYDLVISTYKEIKNIRKVAEQLNISSEQISNILHKNGIEIKSSQEINIEKNSKSVKMFSLNYNFIKEFDSCMEAARYLIENNLSNCKLFTARTHISEVCQGKRITFAKFIWEFSDESEEEKFLKTLDKQN